MAELSKSGTLDERSLADWKRAVGSEWLAKSTRSASYNFRIEHTLIQGNIAIWTRRGQVVNNNTKMEQIYLLEALPASFSGTGS